MCIISHNFRGEASGGRLAGWFQLRGSHEAASEGLTAAGGSPSRWLRVSSGRGLGSSHLAPAQAECPHGTAAGLPEPVTQDGREGRCNVSRPWESAHSAREEPGARAPIAGGRVLRGCQRAKRFPGSKELCTHSRHMHTLAHRPLPEIVPFLLRRD